jgi:hypothetical protein
VERYTPRAAGRWREIDLLQMSSELHGTNCQCQQVIVQLSSFLSSEVAYALVADRFAFPALVTYCITDLCFSCDGLPAQAILHKESRLGGHSQIEIQYERTRTPAEHMTSFHRGHDVSSVFSTSNLSHLILPVDHGVFPLTTLDSEGCCLGVYLPVKVQ